MAKTDFVAQAPIAAGLLSGAVILPWAAFKFTKIETITKTFYTKTFEFVLKESTRPCVTTMQLTMYSRHAFPHGNVSWECMVRCMVEMRGPADPFKAILNALASTVPAARYQLPGAKFKNSKPKSETI